MAEIHPKIRRAHALAERAHAGQIRKFSGLGYIVHPEEVHKWVKSWTMGEIYSELGRVPERRFDTTIVANSDLPLTELFRQHEERVKNFPVSAKVARRLECAAYLHDVREDCPQISEQEIIDACGHKVLALVKEVTNPSKGSTASRAARKQMDRDHLLYASREAKILKLCDRIVNLDDFRANFIAHCLGDAQSGPDVGFMTLYAQESQLLLEVLRGTDYRLELELQKRINMNLVIDRGQIVKNG